MSMFRRNIIARKSVLRPVAQPTYLTQWKIVGNSEVHGVSNLTSWKVSGNSVVGNNTIMSCGDLGQDGKYHVKISNGATIYDIPLDAPLRKVNDVADTIEFPSGTDGKALVTRNFKEIIMSSLEWIQGVTRVSNSYRYLAAAPDSYPHNASEKVLTMNTGGYINQQGNNTWGYAPTNKVKMIGAYPPTSTTALAQSSTFAIYDPNYDKEGDLSAFLTYLADKLIIYRLATPTTELVDAPQIAVSLTDTYTSTNETPYSAFEHTENNEIWSCGEYNATDGKYHILVQPLGGSIVDIALDEPLRKVNDVADTLEYPTETSGKALLTTRIEENGGELLPLDTPTTELVDAPQIEEADSYSMVISQGGKAVEWSEFFYTLNYLLTDNENNLLVDSENYQLTVQS